MEEPRSNVAFIQVYYRDDADGSIFYQTGHCCSSHSRDEVYTWASRWPELSIDHLSFFIPTHSRSFICDLCGLYVKKAEA